MKCCQLRKYKFRASERRYIVPFVQMQQSLNTSDYMCCRVAVLSRSLHLVDGDETVKTQSFYCNTVVKLHTLIQQMLQSSLHQVKVVNLILHNKL